MGLNPFSWGPFPFAIIIIRQKVKKSIGQKENIFFLWAEMDAHRKLADAGV